MYSVKTFDDETWIHTRGSLPPGRDDNERAGLPPTQALLSKISREAHPIRAAEGRQISCDSFAPTGLHSEQHLPTGLRPWLRSVAAPRLNKDAAIAATFVPRLIIHPYLIWRVLPTQAGNGRSPQLSCVSAINKVRAA
jgi:hypothetical protein